MSEVEVMWVCVLVWQRASEISDGGHRKQNNAMPMSDYLDISALEL